MCVLLCDVCLCDGFVSGCKVCVMCVKAVVWGLDGVGRGSLLRDKLPPRSTMTPKEAWIGCTLIRNMLCCAVCCLSVAVCLSAGG